MCGKLRAKGNCQVPLLPLLIPAAPSRHTVQQLSAKMRCSNASLPRHRRANHDPARFCFASPLIPLLFLFFGGRPQRSAPAPQPAHGTGRGAAKPTPRPGQVSAGGARASCGAPEPRAVPTRPPAPFTALPEPLSPPSGSPPPPTGAECVSGGGSPPGLPPSPAPSTGGRPKLRRPRRPPRERGAPQRRRPGAATAAARPGAGGGCTGEAGADIILRNRQPQPPAPTPGGPLPALRRPPGRGGKRRRVPVPVPPGRTAGRGRRPVAPWPPPPVCAPGARPALPCPPVSPRNGGGGGGAELPSPAGAGMDGGREGREGLGGGPGVCSQPLPLGAQHPPRAPR